MTTTPNDCGFCLIFSKDQVTTLLTIATVQRGMFAAALTGAVIACDGKAIREIAKLLEDIDALIVHLREALSIGERAVEDVIEQASARTVIRPDRSVN